jgi:hypothetical protein
VGKTVLYCVNIFVLFEPRVFAQAKTVPYGRGHTAHSLKMRGQVLSRQRIALGGASLSHFVTSAFEDENKGQLLT